MSVIAPPRRHSPLAAARALAAATPAGRDRYVDLLRVGSMLVVVLGHWLMTVTFWQDGRLTGGNALTSVRGLWLATWVLQVMPVFFFVGGFSNLVTVEAVTRRGGGWVEFVTGRAARLLRPGTRVGSAGLLRSKGIVRPVSNGFVVSLIKLVAPECTAVNTESLCER